MPDLLTDQNREYSRRTREVVSTVAFPRAGDCISGGGYPWEVLTALAEAGLTGVWIPGECGGRGDGFLNLCVVVEELSCISGCAGVAFAVSAAGSFPLLLAGTEAQKMHWLPGIAAGSLLAAPAYTGDVFPDSAASSTVHAVREGEIYIVNGEIPRCLNGGAADIYTVLCSTDGGSGRQGLSILLVEKGLEGFVPGKPEDETGLRCLPDVGLRFENCIVPADYLLGEREGRGFQEKRHSGVYVATVYAALAVGIARRALDHAGECAAGHRDGRNIVHVGAPVSPRLERTAVKIDRARNAVYSAAHVLDGSGASLEEAAATENFASCVDCAVEAAEIACELSSTAECRGRDPAEGILQDVQFLRRFTTLFPARNGDIKE